MFPCGVQIRMLDVAAGDAPNTRPPRPRLGDHGPAPSTSGSWFRWPNGSYAAPIEPGRLVRELALPHVQGVIEDGPVRPGHGLDVSCAGLPGALAGLVRPSPAGPRWRPSVVLGEVGGELVGEVQSAARACRARSLVIWLMVRPASSKCRPPLCFLAQVIWRPCGAQPSRRRFCPR